MDISYTSQFQRNESQGKNRKGNTYFEVENLMHDFGRKMQMCLRITCV